MKTLTRFAILVFLSSLILSAYAFAQKTGVAEKTGKKALLVIDVQKVYFEGGLKVTHPAGSIDNIARAMDAAKEHGVHIVIIQHSSRNERSSFRKGNPLWELHPEIAKRPYDHLTVKSYPGSFTKTDLDEWLKSKGIETVVITGYMTQMCCDSTARQAMHKGYKVEFLSDGTGTLAFNNAGGKVTAEELHRSILVAQASGLSKVMSTEDWIKSLKR